MQKLELRNNLHQIITGLKSNEIVRILDGAQLQGPHLMKFIIESKAAYDRATTDNEKIMVFEQFKLPEIYTTANFSQIMRTVSSLGDNQRQRTDFLSHSHIATFYSQHKTLISTYNIVENLLLEDIDFFDKEENFSISVAQNNGNLILQIIDENKISLDKLLSIVKHLKELIEVVYLLYDKVEEEQFVDSPLISMLDSGSDINFAVKIPKKAANLIAQIIKELWDVTVNNKSFRHQQKLKDVEDSISVFSKINEAKIKGIIEPEMAEILKKGIFENTKEIILKNTLTKEIVLETKELSNRELLLEQTKIYQLEEGDQNKKPIEEKEE